MKDDNNNNKKLLGTPGMAQVNALSVPQGRAWGQNGQYGLHASGRAPKDACPGPGRPGWD